MRHTIKMFPLTVVTILLLVANAQAHKVTIFAWVDGSRVFTQSKFSGGRLVNNGKVEVFDGSGQMLLSGQTDEKGEFSFEIPKITDLNVVLTAGMGHQNSWRLSAAELGGQTPDGVDEKPPATTMPSMAQPEPSIPKDATVLTAHEVEAIVARQLDQKLQPLTRMMASAQEKGPSVGEILGGIGYIIGLVGLGAYLRYRKDNQQS